MKTKHNTTKGGKITAGKLSGGMITYGAGSLYKSRHMTPEDMQRRMFDEKMKALRALRTGGQLKMMSPEESKKALEMWKQFLPENYKVQGGAFSAGALRKHFISQGVHPKVMEQLDGAGFFNSISDIVNKAKEFYNKLKDKIMKKTKLASDLTGLAKDQYEKKTRMAKELVELAKDEYDKATKPQEKPEKPEKPDETGGKLKKGKSVNHRRQIVGQLMRKKENGGKGMTMAEAQRYYNQHY